MSQHIVPIKTYVGIFWILMILMVATVLAAFLDLGVLEVPVAMAIAVAKTLLIALFFMHLKFSSKLTWIFAAASALWLSILAAFLMSDTGTRGTTRLPVLETGERSQASAYFDGPKVPDDETLGMDPE